MTPHDRAAVEKTLKGLRIQWLAARKLAHGDVRTRITMANINRNLQVLHDLMEHDMTETPTQPNPNPNPAPPQPDPTTPAPSPTQPQ